MELAFVLLRSVWQSMENIIEDAWPVLLFLFGLPLITIIVLVFVGKLEKKFTFDMQQDEVNLASDVVYYAAKDKTIAIRSVLYLTNNRLVIFPYKYQVLSFIPFLGESIQMLFKDKNKQFDIGLHNILDVKLVQIKDYKRTSYSGTVNVKIAIYNYEATVILKNLEKYRFTFQYPVENNCEKPELLEMLTLKLMEIKND
ncbi:MAG: hypothetical protein U0U67_15440 [Chitinophagales bacterium]